MPVSLTLSQLALLAGFAVAFPTTEHLSARQAVRGPVLGWNGWNQGQCDAASEKVALETARTLVSRGLKDAGYVYVNIDDCWSTRQRDGSGNLVPDPSKFPRGMKALTDEIHSMGLKFGLYGDSGTKTCAGFPGSQGHEEQDAKLLASWGVDLWKHDNCYTPCYQGNDIHTCPDDQGPDSRPRYQTMGNALKSSGRDILYSLCNWGYDEVWKWAPEVGGETWRMSTDNFGKWEHVVMIANKASGIASYTKAGAYNDLDMMIIGNGALNAAQERTHFAIWAISKSPILMGTNLSKLSDDQIKLITNKALLEINQDPLAAAASAFTPPGTSGPGNGELQPFWSGPLTNGHVVAMLASKGAQTINMNLKDVPGLEDVDYNWTELLTGRTGSGKTVSATLERHDTAVFRVTRA